MGFPSGNIMRATFGGRMAGAEKWEVVTWWVFTGGTPSSTDFGNTVNDLNDAWTGGLWNAATTPFKSRNTTAVDYSSLKADLYVDGVLTQQATRSPTAIAGTISTSGSPNYTAMCCTLTTASFGRSARGRMYLPCTAAVSATTGLLPTSNQDAINVAAFFKQTASTHTGVSVQAVVFSRAQGAARPITGVRIDQYPDTQHGRTRQMTGGVSFTQTV